MDATLSSSSRGNDRPNVVPGVDVTPGPRMPNEWFNIQTFAIQPQYTFGNAGRNIVTGVPVFSIDFSAKKSFFVSERKYLQFRFEASFSQPRELRGSAVNASQLDANGVPIPCAPTRFGTITSTKAGIDMRELQFSLKLIFQF